MALRDRYGHSCRYDHPFPGLEGGVFPSVEVDAPVPGVGVRRHGKSRVETFQRDAHSVDYACGVSTDVSRLRTPEREADRRTILRMLETTPATAARPLGPGTTEEPIPDLDFDWQPRPLGRIITSKREYRWPIVIGAVVIGAAVLFVARFFVLLPAAEAEARLAAYATAVDEFSSAIDAMESAASLTDPVAASRFLQAADDLREVASPGPPGILPFIPAGPVADVKAARHRLLILADAADAFADRLARAAAYRTASEEILAIPLLPFSAPAELIDPAAEALADMQFASEAAADRLDDDEEYAAYRVVVENALAEMDGLIDRYLLALRRATAGEAAAAVAQLQALRDGTISELESVVGQVEEDAEALIVDLRTVIDQVQIIVGG